VAAQEAANREKADKIKRGEKVSDTQGVAEQKMGGVHLVESQKGTRDWELFSQSAEGSQGAANWKLHQVKVLFYNKEKVEFTVTGDTGTIDSATRNISVVGNVVTRSENGYVFKTPSIYYSTQTRMIESPETVEMTGPPEGKIGGMVLKGRKMKAFVDQSKMLIQESVSAEKPYKENKKFQIVADVAEFSGKNNQAKFFGAVRMNYDDMRLEGPEASFIYSSATNFLSSVEVRGGVKVSDVDKFATSDKVNLDLLANRYVFQGRPKVIQNNDELTGEEIVFLEGGKKVKVERVRARVENKEQ
jgi:LPS export ABC transporter protein LptC